MSAKKKSIIAIIVGAVLGSGFAFYMYDVMSQSSTVSQSEILPQCLVMIPCFILYAFGYAFGWKRCKGFVAKAAKVSADIAFFSMIIQLISGKGLGRGLMLSMFVFCFAIGIVWLPGVVWGIMQLIAEFRDESLVA